MLISSFQRIGTQHLQNEFTLPLKDQLPGDVSLLLTNAIWFKDSWNQPFDPVFER